MDQKVIDIVNDESGLSDRLVTFFSSYKRRIVYLSLALVLIFALSFRFWEGNKEKAQQAFLQAKEIEQEILHGNNEIFASSVSALQSLVDATPNLKEEYSGRLAQAKLLEGKVPELPRKQRSLRQKTKAAPYKTFTEVSLLVAQGKLQEAASASEELAEQLSEQPHSTLALYNAARLGFLYQSLNQEDKEVKQWKKLQALVRKAPLENKINKVFSKGNLSFNNYVNKRLSKIN